jgi:hypothetical protein
MTAEVRFLAEERDFSPLHSIQTGSGLTKPLIKWVPGAFFPRAKAAKA